MANRGSLRTECSKNNDLLKNALNKCSEFNFLQKTRGNISISDPGLTTAERSTEKKTNWTLTQTDFNKENTKIVRAAQN